MSYIEEPFLEEDFEEGKEEDWYSSHEGREYIRQLNEELEEEMLHTNFVWQQIDTICFLSYSKGSKRKRLKHPRRVVLLKFRNTRSGRWMLWNGEDKNTKTLKWDEFSEEVFGKEFCAILFSRGIHPDDYLRSKIKKLL